jgi:hypothetical protein
LEMLACSEGSRAGLVSDDSRSRPAMRSAGPSFRVPVCVVWGVGWGGGEAKGVGGRRISGWVGSNVCVWLDYGSHESTLHKYEGSHPTLPSIQKGLPRLSHKTLVCLAAQLACYLLSAVHTLQPAVKHRMHLAGLWTHCPAVGHTMQPAHEAWPWSKSSTCWSLRLSDRPEALSGSPLSSKRRGSSLPGAAATAM